MMPTAVRLALNELQRALDRELPGRVLRITLFGSTARGEATEDSDVDVLVLATHLTFRERARIIDLAAEAGFAHGLVVSPLVLSSDEWRALEERERRLPREVARDGVDL